jgi:hypothetical protein
MTYFVDTNIFLRHLTGDDPVKAKACFEIFQRAQRQVGKDLELFRIVLLFPVVELGLLVEGIRHARQKRGSRHLYVSAFEQVEGLGGNMFYIDRLNEAKPGVYENKLEFSRIYNGACTRLGEKEMNASVNTFIDQAKANGTLAKAHEKWMKRPMPGSFPESIDGVPFVAS